MARGTSRGGKKAEKERRLGETFDAVISDPPYSDGFDPIAVSRAALDRLPLSSNLSKSQAKRLRERFDAYVENLATYRERLDPVRDPDASFDPANPDTIGRLVVLALLAQDRVPLLELRPTYGSGVYAIYYVGDHPAYAEIANTETPIYVGKADPDEPRAATPREQGVRLFGRLADHRDAVREVETYATANGITDALRVQDFECRRLVCATNAQLVAERHLIDVFKPAWNSETKICFGISKHGDNSETRRNKKSPWDVLHPGRDWAMTSPVREGMTADSVTLKLAQHFSDHPPHRDLEGVIENMLDSFRQIARASAEISEAAAETEEVAAAQAEDAKEDRDDDEGDTE
ncbi:MAG: Eco29kI family restriction endonuclease [Methylobacteriaceae bacterium]|nr:Eco29kI family restriction endonuclease [Methylobacteriaceae bacterium]